MNLLQTCGGGKCSFIIEWHLCIDCKWVKFASGAFGDWGCGAWWNTEWFQFQLPQQAKEHHITFLELACAALGPQWQGQLIYVWCDNQAAEHAITARSYPGLMHLLQCLFFMEASFQFQLPASHIPGVNNTPTDLLSCKQLPLFLSYRSFPTWTQLFSSFVLKA